MSIHAELSREALARMNAQKRNSTITSVMIALLASALFCLGLYFCLIQSLKVKEAEIVTYIPPAIEQSDDRPKPKVTVQQKRPPSSNQVSKVIVSTAPSEASLPMPDVDVPKASEDFGENMDFGDAWGDEDSMDVGSFGAIHTSMRKRCSKEDRAARLKETGGDDATEQSVERGLQWLKRNQKGDGSWSNHRVAAMTGLSLLSYFGRCETPQSSEYGESCKMGLVYLIDKVMRDKEGRIADDLQDPTWPYEHGVCTYALAEGYCFAQAGGFTIPNLEEAVKKSVNYILKNRHQGGGWDYYFNRRGHYDKEKEGESDRKGDTCLTGWMLQALKAAKHTGLEFDKQLWPTARKALEYVKRCQHGDGAVGYEDDNYGLGHRKGIALTAKAILDYQMWGKPNDKLVKNGIRFLKDKLYFDWNGGNCDLYAQYYLSQALINDGNNELWKKYNVMLKEQILANQNPDGSWKDVNNGHPPELESAHYQGSHSYNTHYRTCLAILCLESYYRFLFLNQ